MATAITSIMVNNGPKKDLEAIHNIYFALITHFTSRPADQPDDDTTASLRESLATVETILGLTNAGANEHNPESQSHEYFGNITVPDPQQTAQAALDAQYNIDYTNAYMGVHFDQQYNENFYGDPAVPSQPTSYPEASEYTAEGTTATQQPNADYAYNANTYSNPTGSST